jgi:hypothetical protein
MGAKQDDIVAKIESAHGELMDLIGEVTPDQWTMAGVNHPEIQRGEDEHRKVGVIVHHVASAYASTRERCEAWISGKVSAPLDPDRNARHEAENPDPDQAETIRLLEASVAALEDFARRLSDQQLEAKGMFVQGEVTVAELLGKTTPYHIRWHAGSIRATLEPKAQT